MPRFRRQAAEAAVPLLLFAFKVRAEHVLFWRRCSVVHWDFAGCRVHVFRDLFDLRIDDIRFIVNLTRGQVRGDSKRLVVSRLVIDGEQAPLTQERS